MGDQEVTLRASNGFQHDRTQGIMDQTELLPPTLAEPQVESIVKLGGSAITMKSLLETFDMEVMGKVARQIASTNEGKTILVHGAGSFGHQHAKEYGIANGRSVQNSDVFNIGFGKTRNSVITLSSKVVASLHSHDVPALGCSPFPVWMTENEVVVRDNVDDIYQLLKAGFIPVLHGDAVVDRAKGSAILSGDAIIEVLCARLRPKFVVFLTDVAGVFDRPPSEDGARLIREIQVMEQGDVLLPRTIVSEHDVTGGILSKIQSSISIARLGIDVFIVQAGSPYALEALKGMPPEIGTHIYKLPTPGA